MKGTLSILLAASVLLLAACTATAPAPSRTPTTSPTTQPTAEPAPTDSPAPTVSPIPSAVFEPASVPDPATNSGMASVVPGGDGLIAIGFDGAFGATVWTSTDGRAWRDVTPSVFEAIGLAKATVRDGRIVAVGRGDTINVEADTATALVSDDGLTWTQAVPAEDGGFRGQLIDVLSTDDGLIAVGGVPGADAAGFWRSDDGETWERIGEDIPGAFLWSVVEGGPGFVAAGWRRTPDPSVAVWTSADGAAWELAPDPEGYRGFEATDVVATASGALVMVGGNLLGSEARIWTSSDGLEWTVAEVTGGLADSSVRSVVDTPIGLLAVGGIGMDAAVWRSSDDGATWSVFGDVVREAYFHDALVTDDALVLFGATQTGTLATGIDARAAIWTARFED